jgi:hypothetical protein
MTRKQERHTGQSFRWRMDNGITGIGLAYIDCIKFPFEVRVGNAPIHD